MLLSCGPETAETSLSKKLLQANVLQIANLNTAKQCQLPTSTKVPFDPIQRSKKSGIHMLAVKKELLRWVELKEFFCHVVDAKQIYNIAQEKVTSNLGDNKAQEPIGDEWVATIGKLPCIKYKISSCWHSKQYIA